MSGTYTPTEGKGTIFRNDRKEKDNHPDYQGQAMTGGAAARGMTRLEALEAVAVAARKLEAFRCSGFQPWQEWCAFDRAGGVSGALAALDAHTEVQEVTTLAAVKEAFEGAKAQNETLRGVLSSQTPATVTLAVWEYTPDGEAFFCRSGGKMDIAHNQDGGSWTRLGTVTLPLDRERGE